MLRRVTLSELIRRWRDNPGATARVLHVPALVLEATGPARDAEEVWSRTRAQSVGGHVIGDDPRLFFVEKRAGVPNAFPMGVTVGRIETNDIAIEDPSLSRFHAWLAFDARKKQWVLHDADSKNGTMVDGVELTPGGSQALESGQVIRLGSVVLRFLLPEALVERLELLA